MIENTFFYYKSMEKFLMFYITSTFVYKFKFPSPRPAKRKRFYCLEYVSMYTKEKTISLILIFSILMISCSCLISTFVHSL